MEKAREKSNELDFSRFNLQDVKIFDLRQDHPDNDSLVTEGEVVRCLRIIIKPRKGIRVNFKVMEANCYYRNLWDIFYIYQNAKLIFASIDFFGGYGFPDRGISLLDELDSDICDVKLIYNLILFLEESHQYSNDALYRIINGWLEDVVDVMCLSEGNDASEVPFDSLLDIF